jgi:membrane fusion protein, multidrug efflux system
MALTRFSLLVFVTVAFSAAAAAAPDELLMRGFLKPVEQVTLSSRAKGMTSVVAEEGSYVKAGEVLMQLEDDLERIQLEQQRKVLEKRTFEADSTSRLHEERAVSADHAMSAEVNLHLARLQLELAETHLQRTRLLAPFSGYVSRRFREPGEAVDEFVPVLSLVNFSEVLLETHVSAEWMPRLREGQEVDVTVGLYPDQVFRGRVSFISPVIDPATHEFLMRVRVPNGDERLRPGMRAAGRLRPEALARGPVEE